MHASSFRGAHNPGRTMKRAGVPPQKSKLHKMPIALPSRCFTRCVSILSWRQPERTPFGLLFGREKLDADFIAGNAYQLAAPISEPGRGKQQKEFLEVQSFERAFDTQSCPGL